MQKARALVRRSASPWPVDGGAGSVDGAVDVLLAGHRRLRERLARGRAPKPPSAPPATPASAGGSPGGGSVSCRTSPEAGWVSSPLMKRPYSRSVVTATIGTIPARTLDPRRSGAFTSAAEAGNLGSDGFDGSCPRSADSGSGSADGGARGTRAEAAGGRRDRHRSTV